MATKKKKSTAVAKRRPAAKAVARRRAPKKKMDMVGVLTAVAMAGAGYLAADFLRRQDFMAKISPNMQAGGLAVAAGALGVFMPSLLPVAVGIGANGVVALVGPMLQLAPPANGIGELSESDKRLLAQFAQPMNGDEGMVNGGGGNEFVNGDEGMVNGDETDRAYN